jgi:hypothetical protein
MTTLAHPTLAPEIRPFTARTTRPRRTFKVVDPLTGDSRYFRNEEAADCYATRLEIAAATLDLE